MGVRDWESLGTSPSRIQKGFGETLAEVEGEDALHLSKKTTSAGTSRLHVPPEVEPQNLDFDVNEFLRSSPNPDVASVFGDCEIIQKAGSTSRISRDEVSVFELWR